jgi:hypothetical protein
MLTNSIKTIALIIFECCPIATCYNITTFVIIRCLEIVKKNPSIFCAYTHTLCVLKIEKKNKSKITRRRKEKEKTTNIVIHSHVNHTFLLLNLQIEPQPLGTFIIP